jgi:hypothetical protein
MLGRMNTSPASDTQVSAVDSACREFGAHWRSFDHMPFACEFLGGLEDVRALDYLDYEGLGYPASYLTGVALVWGHVLQQRLGMSWATGYNGEQLLIHDAPGNRITVWPFARVLEVQERSLPQFGRYAWLLDRVLRDCLQFGALSAETEAWARGVIETWEREGTPWS